MAQVEGTFQIIDKGEVLEVQAFNRVDLPWDQMSHDHQQLLEDFFAGKTAIA
jgi:hypothetical protein